MKKIIIFVLFLVLLPSIVSAATINAASCSRIDVGNAVASAVDGDTVAIPAGTCTWTSAVSITKAITLSGPACTTDANGRAISCPTVITNDVTSGSGVAIDVTLVANKITRVSNIELVGGPNSGLFGFMYVQGLNTDNRRFRFDHLKCMNTQASNPGSGPCINFFQAYGVVDHSTFISDKSVGLGHVWGTSPAGSVNGDENWNAGAQFGTDKFVFFDDDTITNTGGDIHALTDAHSGGRYVIRYSTLTNNNPTTHGVAGSRERGGMAFEFYNNLYNLTNGNLAWFSQGTGATTIHDNWIYATSPPVFSLRSYALWDARDPFGLSDGRNQWDVNSPSNPYATATATSVGVHTVSCSGCNWPNYAGYVVRKTGGPSVKTCSQVVQVSGSTYRATCNNHGFVNGDFISLYGSAFNTGSLSAYSFIYTISNVATNTFDVSLRYSAGTPSNVISGEILATKGLWSGAILSNTATQIAFLTSIYGGAYELSFSVGDTFEINKILNVMDGNGRSGGSLMTLNIPPTPPPGWNDQTTVGEYQWNNKRCPASPPTENCAGATTDVAYSSDAQLIENTHYFNGVPRPGYTPYTYPHPLTVSGNTINAASCSWTDVNNAINPAQDGDTVQIPAGTCAWTSTLFITKAITLQGSGVGNTIIQDNAPGTYDAPPLMDWTLVANKISRMTGIEFQAGSRVAARSAGVVRIHGSNIDNRRIRVDNNKFNNLNSFGLSIDGAIGVIDHNTFLTAQLSMFIRHDNWNGGQYGDKSWTADNQFGTDQFIFIEDNLITKTGGYGGTQIDGDSGARYVFRYNNVVDGSIEGHGTESGQRNRGTRAVEIYNNQFTGTNLGQTATFVRSGVGVIHDNAVSGYFQVSTPFKLTNFRNFGQYVPWAADGISSGGADGTNPWDKNVPGGPFLLATATGVGTLTVTVSGASWTPNQWRGYTIKKTSGSGSGQQFSEVQSNTATQITFLDCGACGQGDLSFSAGNTFELYKVDQAMDQPGRKGGSEISGYNPVIRPAGWNDQVTDPWYEWNNLREGGANVNIIGNVLTIRANEHYFNDVPRPGYTTYTYPHPLVTGVQPPDATPPSQVTGLTATAISQNQINLAWNAATDNIGVAGYRIYRGGTQITTTTSNSYTNTGLNPSTTYSYTITAYDAAGNVGMQSSGASATTTAPDITPPTVSIISPTGGIVSGTITISANASDNVGVAGVQFIIDGNNAGSEDTTSPYSISWSSSSVANGTHSITVVARDAAGNSVTSNAVSVNVQNAAAATGGLVAAYSFDEGSGTTAGDASGNGNTGTLTNGSTWTAGKYGSALGLDGVNDYVFLGNSIIGAGDLTVCTWIYQKSLAPITFGSIVDNTQFYIGADSYLDPEVYIRISSNGGGSNAASASFQANTWQHLCVARSGSTSNIYVNGAISGLANQNTGTPAATGWPVVIGRYSTVGAQYFYGFVDNMRIYNRTLSQSEIQNDMNTAIGGTGYSGIILRGRVSRSAGVPCPSCNVNFTMNGVNGIATTATDGTFMTVLATTFSPGTYNADIVITDGGTVKSFRKRITIA